MFVDRDSEETESEQIIEERGWAPTNVEVETVRGGENKRGEDEIYTLDRTTQLEGSPKK